MTLVAYVVLGSGDMGRSLHVKETARRIHMTIFMDKSQFHRKNLLMVIPRLLAVVMMDTAGMLIMSVAYYC